MGKESAIRAARAAKQEQNKSLLGAVEDKSGAPANPSLQGTDQAAAESSETQSQAPAGQAGTGSQSDRYTGLKEEGPSGGRRRENTKSSFSFSRSRTPSGEAPDEWVQPEGRRQSILTSVWHRLCPKSTGNTPLATQADETAGSQTAAAAKVMTAGQQEPYVSL